MKSRTLRVSIGRNERWTLLCQRICLAVLADATQLRQVVMNLIVMRLSYGGRIRTGTRVQIGERHCDDQCLALFALRFGPSSGGHYYMSL